MLLGFATSHKLIELQDSLGVDVVHIAGDLSYAGLSGDLTPFNDVSEDDEFGHVRHALMSCSFYHLTFCGNGVLW